MSAWVLRAVACGSLLTMPAPVGAQEPPPRAAIEALAGVAHPRPAPASPGAGELERALAAQDWPRAEQLLAQAIERSPRSTALLKQIAGVFLADRRPLNAAIALKKAEALAPLDPESRFRLVLAYVAMGQREWARPELERLVTAAPETAIYHYWLGRLDYDAGQYAAAVAHLQAAAIRDPSFPRTFDNLGLCYEALNQIDVALTQYREAVRLNRLAVDPSPWPAINLGSALARGGAYGEAETVLREAVRIDPAAAPAQYHLGTVLEQTNRARRGHPGAARCRRRRSRLRRPALRAGADLPAAGTDRGRRRRAGRVHGPPPGPDARRGRSGVEAVTGARLLVAAVAFLALSAPSSPRAEPGSGSGRGAARAGAGAAQRARRDRGRPRPRRRGGGEGGDRSGDRRVSRGSGRPQPRRRDRRTARRVAGRPGSFRGGHPPAAAIAGGLRQPRAAAPGARGCRPTARPAALAVYARLLAIDPQQPEALFQTAVLHVLDGRSDAARQAIDRLPEAARGRPPVLAVRAVALAGSGDADGARSTVAALAAHPQLAREDIDAVLPALARLPAPGTEQAFLELLDRRGWAAPATLRRLAAIESAAGRHVEARAWLEKAAARGVPDGALLIELARAAFKAGDAKGALGYLAHARDLEPTNVAVHFLFGIVCVELNLGAEAYESLARAVALAPDDPDINYAMGAVSLHRHDSSEALPYFEAYVRLRPGDPRGRFALGAAKYHSQRLEEAVTDLAAAANDQQTAAGAHYYLARIARQRQDLETARREIDAALGVNASFADGWAERGLIETRRGDYASAEAALQKALTLDPDNYEATLHLAALYGRTRDPRKAAQEARLQTLVARREIRAQEFLRLVQAVP